MIVHPVRGGMARTSEHVGSVLLAEVKLHPVTKTPLSGGIRVNDRPEVEHAPVEVERDGVSVNGVFKHVLELVVGDRPRVVAKHASGQ